MRFALNLALQFREVDSDVWLYGYTEEMAATSISFRSNAWVEPQSRIEMVIRMPVADACNVECTGTVLRVDEFSESDTPALISATIDRYCFVRADFS